MNFERQFKQILNFDSLSKPVKAHLKNVYSSFAVCMLVAALGGFIHMYTNLLQASLLTVFASLGLLLLLMFTPHAPSNVTKRFMYLQGFAFFSGIGLGPLLDIVVDIDPSIIPTAFLGTSMIFLCFTLASLFSSDRKFLFLGGFLMSGLSTMLLLGVANLFFRSTFIYNINLYGGLIIMCGFVLYDTQLIVAKREMGDDDFIWHCVDLFIDFINIFRRLLIILASKEKKRKD